MNELLFFALPIATIILAIVLQKIIKCPILVALTFFAIYLIVTFAFFTANFLIFTIVYTILAYIAASITRWICENLGRNIFFRNINAENINTNNLRARNVEIDNDEEDDDNDDDNNHHNCGCRCNCNCNRNNERHVRGYTNLSNNWNVRR